MWKRASWWWIVFWLVVAPWLPASAGEVDAGSDSYYVAEGGRPVGPLTLEAVLRRLESGAVDEETLVWRPGMKDWAPLHTLPEWVEALSQMDSDQQPAPEPLAAPGVGGEEPEALGVWLDELITGCSRDLNTYLAANQWPDLPLWGGQCFLSAPPDWQVAVDGMLVWLESAEGGFFTIQLYLPGSQWDAPSALQQVFASAAGRLPGLEILSMEEKALPAGLQAQWWVVLFRFSHGGRTAVGRLSMPFIPCPFGTPLCTQSAHGAWADAEALPRLACTLVGIQASFHCPRPSGPYCDSIECKMECLKKKKAEGVCTPQQGCLCLDEPFAE